VRKKGKEVWEREAHKKKVISRYLNKRRTNVKSVERNRKKKEENRIVVHH
jgi:hypothetical protein